MAKSSVTKKAFWLAASAGSSTSSPFSSASGRSASTVSATSPVATGSASGPFFARLRNSVKVAAYSGTTSMLPLSSSGAYSSRFSTGLTSTV